MGETAFIALLCYSATFIGGLLMANLDSPYLVLRERFLVAGIYSAVFGTALLLTVTIITAFSRLT